MDFLRLSNETVFNDSISTNTMERSRKNLLGYLQVILALLAIICNLFIVCVILSSRTLRNSSKHLLILNLSFVDLIKIVALALYVYMNFAESPVYACDLEYISRLITDLTTGLSGFFILLLNIDYIATTNDSTSYPGRRLVGPVILTFFNYVITGIVLVPLLVLHIKPENFIGTPTSSNCWIFDKEYTFLIYEVVSVLPQTFLILMSGGMTIGVCLARSSLLNISKDSNLVRRPIDLNIAGFLTLTLYFVPYVYSLIRKFVDDCQICSPYSPAFLVIPMLPFMKCVLLPFVWLMCPDVRAALSIMCSRNKTASQAGNSIEEPQPKPHASIEDPKPAPFISIEDPKPKMYASIEDPYPKQYTYVGDSEPPKSIEDPNTEHAVQPNNDTSLTNIEEPKADRSIEIPMTSTIIQEQPETNIVREEPVKDNDIGELHADKNVVHVDPTESSDVETSTTGNCEDEWMTGPGIEKTPGNDAIDQAIENSNGDLPIIDNNVEEPIATSDLDDRITDNGLDYPIADNDFGYPVADKDLDYPLPDLDYPIADNGLEDPIADNDPGYPIPDNDLGYPTADRILEDPVADNDHGYTIPGNDLDYPSGNNGLENQIAGTGYPIADKGPGEQLKVEGLDMSKKLEPGEEIML
ncbi:uncharacterized protein LOC126817895 isoform X2 [Patella vulgata]|uniref:uncharacterized protein LOC126817895 isoform X2 n=1 Tax=Patella vulgata TaxID=6465 RepID=UPI00218074C2|nr:uncharacterized protein LOC126817895 isoform X2 [Patella vulgata]